MGIDRVLITGIGVVSPIGVGRDRFWEACLLGRSGAVRLENPWVAASDLATKIACPVSGFDPGTFGIPPREASLLDRTTQFAVAAAVEAAADAGLGELPVVGVDKDRVRTAIGSGIGGLASLETAHAAWREGRSKGKVKRYALPMLIPNAPAGQVAIRAGARGECSAPATACAAGTMALGDAWRAIRDGEADLAFAGGTDGLAGDLDAFAMMGFDRLKTLSTRNDEPERASRPFDRERDGFVLGEGAAVLVLERESHARARGARAYAVVAGYASNCDAYSMLQPDESGERVVALVRAALARAGRSEADVEHVSAHATSTVANDRTEARALRLLFGSRTDEIPVTGLKSMTGHAIGGSGAMEAAALALSMREGILTPTINYEFPDPECDLRVVANRPLPAKPALALKLSYGFGGHNACLVLERP